mgnify:CR=1 FL=1
MAIIFTAQRRGACSFAIIVALWMAGTQAQTTGTVRGFVTDRNGTPVPGATVSIEALAAREPVETLTDDAGHFQHSGLPQGHYSVTADKAVIGGQIFRILVDPGSSVDIRFVLEPGRAPAPWLRWRPGGQTRVAAFEAGVRAILDGAFEDAIAQFQAVLQVMPTCADCRFNIGVSYDRLNRFADAEAAFRDALRIRADYAAAYYGLAEIYSRQQRTEDAAIARGEAHRIETNSMAAGRVRAQDALSRGIAFWNSGAVEDAVRQYREALENDMALVEAYYWLGLAYEAGGDPEAATQALSRYLSAAPGGVHADEARRRLAGVDR